jgi:hypothetical protein
LKPNRIGNFLYNVDRSFASLFWGTSQETISSEVGRIERGESQVGDSVHWPATIWLCKRLAKWLDSTPRIWGMDHTEKAIAHADKLDAVDNGDEQ